MTTILAGHSALWLRVCAVVARVVVIASYFVVWSILYSVTNSYGADPIRTIRMVRPCDLVPWIIQPWTAVIYLLGGLALPLLPFYYNWSWPKLRFVLACYVLCSAVAFLCYTLWPLGIVRPSFEGPGLGCWLMREVVSVDKEANCFPSSHTFYAVLAAILVRHGGAGLPVKAVVYILAAAVCVTTVTTGQHYFLDSVGGAAVAVGSYLTLRLLLPDGTPQITRMGRPGNGPRSAGRNQPPPSKASVTPPL